MNWFLPLLMAPVVIIVQICVWEYLTPELIDIELSLLLVIYASLKSDVILGGLLSFFLGYFLDAFAGRTQGLHTFLYVLVFFYSHTASRAINVNTAPSLMGFVFISALTKGFFFMGYLHWVGGVNLWSDISKVVLPQALILALLSPYVFRLLDHCQIISTYEQQQR